MCRSASISLSVVMLAALAGPAKPDDLPRHLLARWNFERATGSVVVDASGNKHDGQTRGVKAAPERVDGMVGKAMRFRASDGTDILVRDRPQLNPAKGLTITAWIKHEGPIGPAAEILGKKGLAKYIVDGYRLYISKAGRLCLQIGDGGAVSTVSTGRRIIRPGVWYHVAGTFSSGRARLYINGRLVVDEEIPAQQIKPSKNHLVIGNFAGRRNAYPFSGLIDEVNLLSVALDADAIFRLAEPGRLRQ